MCVSTTSLQSQRWRIHTDLDLTSEDVGQSSREVELLGSCTLCKLAVYEHLVRFAELEGRGVQGHCLLVDFTPFGAHCRRRFAGNGR